MTARKMRSQAVEFTNYFGQCIDAISDIRVPCINETVTIDSVHYLVVDIRTRISFDECKYIVVVEKKPQVCK